MRTWLFSHGRIIVQGINYCFFKHDEQLGDNRLKIRARVFKLPDAFAGLVADNPRIMEKYLRN